MEDNIVEDKLVIEARGLGLDYYNHKIFQFLSDLESFYEFLSNSCFDKCNGLLLTGKLSIDSSIYSSIQGSMESIKTLVYMGRLNDAFTLVRKYYDAVISDIYKSILMKEEESAFCVNDIEIKDSWDKSIVRAWTYAQEHLYDLPKKNSKSRTYNTVKDKIKSIDKNLYTIIENIKNKREKNVCNDNVHYNSWSNFVLNNNYKLDNKIVALDDLFKNLQIVLCEHFSYIYTLHCEYFSSSDYIENLEYCMEPEYNSLHLIAPIIQEIFEKYIKTYNKDLSDYIRL